MPGGETPGASTIKPDGRRGKRTRARQRLASWPLGQVYSRGLGRPHRGHGRFGRSWPRSSNQVGGFMSTLPPEFRPYGDALPNDLQHG